LDDAVKVKHRQTHVAKKIATLRNDPQSLSFAEKIRKSFPELADHSC
jgi:hypothetical protein